MTVWIDRGGWQALPPNRQSPLRAETTVAVIHHSATPKPRTVDEARAQVQAIQRDHLQRTTTFTDGTELAWADIAYGELAGPGAIFEGRGRPYRSGATGPSIDGESASLCVLGNYELEPVDDLTADTIVTWLRSVFADYGQIPVKVDRDYNLTACPGGNLVAALPALIEQATTEEPDMPSAQEIADAVWARPIGIGQASYPAANVLGFIMDELQRPDLFEARLVAAIEAAAPSAQIDLSGDEIKRLAVELIAQARR